MTHKCEYCQNSIEPCGIQAWLNKNPGKTFDPLVSNYLPCEDKKDKSHVCCTCEIDETKCELPERIVCSSAQCNLRYSVDYYKNRLEELKQDVATKEARIKDLIDLTNEWRLVNVGSPNSNIADLIAKGNVSIPSIKLLVSKQKLTWDRFPVDVGYTIMCLHEEFAKQWSEWINQKAVKVSIKKDLIDKTNADLKKASNIRQNIANSDGSINPKKAKANLNPYEKIVLHNMKTLGLDQNKAEAVTQSMGMKGEARNLKELGVI